MATDPVSFMNTPLVIAMPRPMAEALGWPDQPIGWSDILALSRSANGWADKGHPEWGRFRLGKTNPNYSTSGLHALIAQTYAATGKTAGLSSEDLQNPTVQQYGRDIESSVVHYGDITMTFLNNWFRADRRGTALNYASAVAVEEKSLIDYNAGNPDGELDQGEKPRPPRTPLVAIYPTEGTLYSDNPLFILDADWVSGPQRAAAQQFQKFVMEPKNQKKVLKFGFRPGNPDVAVGAPITADNGVDPNDPFASTTPTAVTGQNLTQAVELQLLTIRSGNAVGQEPTGDGRSSIGVLAVNVSNLTVNGCTIQPGNGTNGLGGSIGTTGSGGQQGGSGVGASQGGGGTSPCGAPGGPGGRRGLSLPVPSMGA